MTENKNVSFETVDRIAGMLIGLLIGDACGCQYEFNNSLPWNGKIEHKHNVFHKRLQKRKWGVIGQYSDDSEMTLILLRRILSDKEYVSENLIKDYGAWASTKHCMLGKNTRAIFCNAKQVKTYHAHFAKTFPTAEAKEGCQSNGALMRCSPLAILFDNQPVVQDCYMSNPSTVALDCNLVYVQCIRSLLDFSSSRKEEEEKDKQVTEKREEKDKQVTEKREEKEKRKMILDMLGMGIVQTKPVREALNEAIEKKDRFIGGKTRGWCVHSLWCAFYTTLHYDNFTDALHWLMTGTDDKKCTQVRYSDTDTIAAIAGAMMGAKLGYTKMMSEPSINEMAVQVLSVDTTQGEFIRDKKYLVSMTEFLPLCQAAAQFFTNEKNKFVKKSS